MVFNVEIMNSIERDASLIRKLGGPAKVSQAIGPEKNISVQRVQNWLKRGIPSYIKVDYPHLFMPELVQSPTTINTAPAMTVAQEAA